MLVSMRMRKVRLGGIAAALAAAALAAATGAVDSVRAGQMDDTGLCSCSSREAPLEDARATRTPGSAARTFGAVLLRASAPGNPERTTIMDGGGSTALRWGG